MDTTEWLILGAILFGSIAVAIILLRVFANTGWAKRRREAFRKLARELGGKYSETWLARLPEASAPLNTGHVRVEIVTYSNRTPETMIAFDGFSVDGDLVTNQIAQTIGIASDRIKITSSSSTFTIVIKDVLADRDDFIGVVRKIIELVENS